MTLLEKLLDENNNELIVLKDKENNDIRFEQIAMIVIDDEPYFILHALDKIKDVEEEIFIFKIIELSNNEELLTLETNEEIIEEVFKEYEKLINNNNR